MEGIYKKIFSITPPEEYKPLQVRCGAGIERSQHVAFIFRREF
jgi:hypothetical protein